MQFNSKQFLISLSVLFCFSFFSSAQAQEKKGEKIQWMSLQQAMVKHQAQPKKLFVDVFTKWCGWCKRMDATTFEDPLIADYMSKHYYAIKFDAETHDTISVKDKLYMFKPEYKSNEFAVQMLNGSMSYPTSVYFDENLNEIGPVPGYLTAEQLLPILKYFAEDIYKTKKWEDYLNETVNAKK